MAQNYLVVGIYRPAGPTVTHEHITKLVYYDPAKKENWNITIAAAISKIEKDEVIYFVHEAGLSTNLEVVNGQNGKYLRTNGDKSKKDNLLNLPVRGA